MVITRFAPSPTGRLHLGHAYSALLAHDFARANSGRFLLRIEDIDLGRTREAFVDGIAEDLTWLGLAWDGPIVRQSTRLPAYRAALDRLIAAGLAYPCFCTRADIASATQAPHGPEGALYPGTCRALTAAVREARMREPHAWRLNLSAALSQLPSSRQKRGTQEARARMPHEIPALAGTTTDEKSIAFDWHDATMGTVSARPDLLGDVVLARKDAGTSYHLAVTIDDAGQGVTDVVRGEDLFAATHVHRLLQALLALPTPCYHHHPLLTDISGRRLAKRDGATSLADLRTAGADPAKLIDELRARKALSHARDREVPVA